MPPQLSDCPVDVLFEVCKYLDSSDIFALNLACRNLHELCSKDALWRQTSSKLPLDLPPGKSLNDFGGRDLRRLFVKELALRRKWLKDKFAPVRFSKTSASGTVHGLQMLTSQWLLTMASNPGTLSGAIYTLWSLQDVNDIRVVCSLDTKAPHCFGFSAKWQRCGKKIIVAGYMFNSSVQVHSLTLREGVWTFAEVLTLNTVLGALNDCKQSSIYVTQHMVAWCTAQNDGMRLWLINSSTKRCFSVRIPAFDLMPLPVAHMAHDLTGIIVISGKFGGPANQAEQYIRIYSIPAEVTDYTDADSPHGAPIAVENFELSLRSSLETPGISPAMTQNTLSSRHIALDESNNILSIFQPPILPRHTGAYLTRIHIGESSLTFIDGEILRSKLRFYDKAPDAMCLPGCRGFVQAGEQQENGDYSLGFYQFSSKGIRRLPVEDHLERQFMTSFGYDDASGRLCIATWAPSTEHGIRNGLTVLDLI